MSEPLRQLDEWLRRRLDWEEREEDSENVRDVQSLDDLEPAVDEHRFAHEQLE